MRACAPSRCRSGLVGRDVAVGHSQRSTHELRPHHGSDVHRGREKPRYLAQHLPAALQIIHRHRRGHQVRPPKPSLAIEHHRRPRRRRICLVSLQQSIRADFPTDWCQSRAHLLQRFCPDLRGLPWNLLERRVLLGLCLSRTCGVLFLSRRLLASVWSPRRLRPGIAPSPSWRSASPLAGIRFSPGKTESFSVLRAGGMLMSSFHLDRDDAFICQQRVRNYSVRGAMRDD